MLVVVRSLRDRVVTEVAGDGGDVSGGGSVGGSTRSLGEGCIIHSEHRAARALTLRAITFLTLCFSPIANIAPVACLSLEPSRLPLQELARPCLSSFDYCVVQFRACSYLETWQNGKFNCIERNMNCFVSVRGKFRGTLNYNLCAL